MTIREIEESEIKEIKKLEDMIFSDAWSEDSLRESFHQIYTLLLGVWEEDELIGYAIFYIAAGDAEIARLAIHPSHRRKGAARRLLRELENGYKDRHVSRLLLEVRKGNEGAVGFYEDYGFMKDGIRKNYYSNPQEDAVLMSCEPGR